MDPNYFASGGVGASIIVVAGAVYTAINHRRIRSTCCRRTLEASIDIDTTTPPVKVQVEAPKEADEKR